MHLTGGYAPRFLGMFLALDFFRFEGESTLLPTAATPLAALGGASRTPAVSLPDLDQSEEIGTIKK